MTRSLRVVESSEAGDDLTMSDAIHELARQVIADNPSVVVVLWERAVTHKAGDGKPSVVVEIRSLPRSLAVTRGLIDAATEMLYPAVGYEA